MTQLISVITPTFNEVDNVRDCHAAVRHLFRERLGDFAFEHIFCDNGSTDGTRDVLRELAAGDRQVKVIFNSRNFGVSASTLNALSRARGDAVIVMFPADLQDPPELVEQFVRKWESGFKVVYGIRRKRAENFALVFLRRAFYRLLNAFSDIGIPIDVGDFQLVDRVVVDALQKFEERNPYLRGMIASCGFQSTGIEYDMPARRRGRSKMGLLRLLDLAINGIISLSTLPLRACMLSGFFIAVISCMYAAVQFVVNLIYFRELAAPGIPTLIVALFFFGGIQLFFFGILGEYVLAIHRQVRGGPLVIESETFNFDEEP